MGGNFFPKHSVSSRQEPTFGTHPRIRRIRRIEGRTLITNRYVDAIRPEFEFEFEFVRTGQLSVLDDVRSRLIERQDDTPHRLRSDVVPPTQFPELIAQVRELAVSGRYREFLCDEFHDR